LRSLDYSVDEVICMIEISLYIFAAALFVSFIAGLLGIDNIKNFIVRKIPTLKNGRIGSISIVLLIISFAIAILGYILETPHLGFYKLETNEENGIVVTDVYFKSLNAHQMGRLYFRIQLDDDSEEQILDFWPTGGIFMASPSSRDIAPDGKSATLNYSFIGEGIPALEITLTEYTSFTLKGSYGFRKHVDLVNR
jgi:hypothetical protein